MEQIELKSEKSEFSTTPKKSAAEILQAIKENEEEIKISRIYEVMKSTKEIQLKYSLLKSNHEIMYEVQPI